MIFYDLRILYGFYIVHRLESVQEASLSLSGPGPGRVDFRHTATLVAFGIYAPRQLSHTSIG